MPIIDLTGTKSSKKNKIMMTEKLEECYVATDYSWRATIPGTEIQLVCTQGISDDQKLKELSY